MKRRRTDHEHEGTWPQLRLHMKNSKHPTFISTISSCSRIRRARFPVAHCTAGRIQFTEYNRLCSVRTDGMCSDSEPRCSSSQPLLRKFRHSIVRVHDTYIPIKAMMPPRLCAVHPPFNTHVLRCWLICRCRTTSRGAQPWNASGKAH